MTPQDLSEETDGAVAQERLVRQFTQGGYAIVENRPAGPPITLGFELTTWEAERKLKELLSVVGNEFYQEINIVRAALTFSMLNAEVSHGDRERQILTKTTMSADKLNSGRVSVASTGLVRPLFAEATEKARQASHHADGKCSMCAVGDDPSNGLHRGQHRCGNEESCTLCHDAGMEYGDQCAACGRIEKNHVAPGA